MKCVFQLSPRRHHDNSKGGHVKGDLDGMILSHAIFCSACCLCQAKIVYNLHHITLDMATIVVGF